MGYRNIPDALNDILSKITALERRLPRLGSGDSTPVGVVLPFAGDAAPFGYLLATGGTQLIANYPKLFAVLGTTYGGNGTTTFGIPDMRGRTPVGRNAGDADFGSLNDAVGAKTHTLTAAQMPSHTHGGTTNSAGNHNHTQRYNTGAIAAGGGSNVAGMSGAGGNSSGVAQQTTQSDGAHTHTFTTGSAGSGGAHNNIQPSRVLNFIIKV